MKYKVIGGVFQNNQLIGYDLVSEANQKDTVTPQQLYNAVSNNVVVNAVLLNDKFIFKNQLQKRFISPEPQVITMKFTVAELKLLFPYIEKWYAQLQKSQDNNRDAVLKVLGHFIDQKILIDEHERVKG